MVNRGDRFLITCIVPNVESQEVIFKGVQLGFDELPALALYDLTKDIGGHPKGSTITRPTLEGYGFILPNDAP